MSTSERSFCKFQQFTENLITIQAIIKELAECQFTTDYIDYEKEDNVTYKCDENENEEIPGSGYCIFHDESYLTNENNRKGREQKVREKLEDKLSKSVEQRKAVYCIGYYLPDICIKRIFSNPIYFSKCEFHGRTDFRETEFKQGVSFSDAKFKGIVTFFKTSFGRKEINDFLMQELKKLRNASIKSFRDKVDKLAQEKIVNISSLNANFRGAIFEEIADFTLANFEVDAEFDRADFRGEAIFFQTRFGVLAEFLRDNFKGINEKDKADYLRNNFTGGNAYFSTDDIKTHKSADFKKLADFTFALFQDVTFSEATFSEKVIFLDATITGDANFLSANFKNEANFINTKFQKRAEFCDTIFGQKADFSEATFSDEAVFRRSTFSQGAFFSGEFKKQVYFNYAIFEQPSKVTFENSDVSTVSFSGTDITRIRFGDKVMWGGDGYTILEEQRLMKYIEEHKEKTLSDKSIQGENDGSDPLSLELVLSVYRNLRENYEFRLRYDDAGKFFIKEMELKRKYREITKSSTPKHWKFKLRKNRSKRNTEVTRTSEIIENHVLRKHISLTGLYYHFSTYGESILKPVIIGIIIVGLSTAFWLIQANPEGEPTVPSVISIMTSSKFTNITQSWNNTHALKAFERSLTDFLPLLSMPSNVEVGVLDFIVKIVGGGLTFVLLGVALRRKFERKYTR